MLIVTNFSSFPSRWTASSGERGEGAMALTVGEFLRHGRHPGAVFVINCDPPLALKLAAVFALAPCLRKPLVSVDLVLRKPSRKLDKLALPVKRFLLSRVDHHIHYFKDLRGYQEVFGIGPEKSSFVPFKVNLRGHQQLEARPEGEYVLSLGRSLRDFDTFFEAVERLPYPAAIARPDLARLRAHGARLTRAPDRFPKNLLLLDDDGGEESQIRMLRGARLVVLPVLKSSMAASGISTCLNAMLLGKCVIGSAGPGMSDIFSGEVLIVPPEDPRALADAIRQAWENDGLRGKTAEAGRRYALRAGGEADLYQRIIDQVVCWHSRHK